MNRILSVFLIVFSAVYFAAMKADKEEIVINKDLQLVKLDDGIYLHRCWVDDDTVGRFSCNGLVIIAGGEAVLVDTPWDNQKTEILVTFLEKRMRAKAVTHIPGHYHQDCIGGLEYLQRNGVESVANGMTVKKCRESGLPSPDRSFEGIHAIDFHGLKLVCQYFGPGHTADNITVWIPSRGVLFGGCMIRSLDSMSLGYTKEAVIGEWDTTVKKIIDSYQGIRVVVPGHGDPGGPELLTHTIELVRKQQKN